MPWLGMLAGVPWLSTVLARVHAACCSAVGASAWVHNLLD